MELHGQCANQAAPPYWVRGQRVWVLLIGTKQLVDAVEETQQEELRGVGGEQVRV